MVCICSGNKYYNGNCDIHPEVNFNNDGTLDPAKISPKKPSFSFTPAAVLSRLNLS